MAIVINLEYKPYVALYRRLSDALRKAILEGRLKAGDAMPSVRDLSKSLKISSSTTLKAYDDLKKQGLIVSHSGSGTYVSAILPGDLGDLLNERLANEQAKIETLKEVELSKRGKLLCATGQKQEQEHVHVPALEYGGTPLELSPVREWKTLLLKHCDISEDEQYAEVIEPLGFKPLRQAISGYVLRRRSIADGADHVCIFGSKQLRLELIGRILLDEGDIVAYEEPGYPENRHTLEALGATIESVPVDGEGISITALRNLQRPPKLIYVTPSHHDPLGYVMSMQRRQDLLQYAHQVGAFIVEDDFDCEFRYGKPILPALKSLDRYDSVIYMASFWRILYRSLRLSFIVLPESLLTVGTLCKSYLERHLPLLDQLVLTDFINEGYLEKHLKRTQRLLSIRRQSLILAITRYLKNITDPLEESAGTHLMLRFNITLPEHIIEATALRCGFNIMNCNFYYSGQAPLRQYIVPFATVDSHTIDNIVERFSLTLFSAKESPPDAN